MSSPVKKDFYQGVPTDLVLGRLLLFRRMILNLSIQCVRNLGSQASGSYKVTFKLHRSTSWEPTNNHEQGSTEWRLVRGRPRLCWKCEKFKLHPI
jgi:hypothetical protein